LTVGSDVAVLGVKAEGLEQRHQFLLTDGFDHLIARDHELAPGHRARAATPAGVRLTELGAHTLHTRHSAALADDLDGLSGQADSDALVLHELDLEVVRGHLGATAAVDHRHPLCTEALGDGRGVDGGVACSDDHYLVTHLDLVQVDETPLLGHLGGCDERQSLDDPTEFLAWHCQVRHPARPGCDDDGVIVGYQSGRLDVASDLDAGVDGDSETLYELDLLDRKSTRLNSSHVK